MILFLKIWFIATLVISIYNFFITVGKRDKKETSLLEKLIDETKNLDTGITVMVTTLIYVILLLLTTLVYIPQMLLIGTGILSIRLSFLTIANIILGYVVMLTYSFVGMNDGIGFKIKVIDMIWSFAFYSVIIYTLFTI